MHRFCRPTEHPRFLPVTSLHYCSRPDKTIAYYMQNLDITRADPAEWSYPRSRRDTGALMEDLMRTLSLRPFGSLRPLVLALSLAVATIVSSSGMAMAQQ